MRAAGLLLIALAACGGGGPVDAETDAGGAAGGTGRVAFVDEPGNAVVVDLATGQSWTIVPLFGEVGQLALGPDGAELAFAVTGGGINVFVAELAEDGTAPTRRIAPGPGFDIRWGGGDYFVYDTYDATIDPWKTWVAVDGAAETRQIDPVGSIVLAPVDPLLAFVECADTSSPCGKQVAVESAIDDRRSVIATGADVEPLTFTPDGTRVVVATRAADVSEPFQLTVHAVSDGTVVDLGMVDGVAWHDKYASAVSPDGTEILVARDAAIVAVELAGKASRTILPLSDEDTSSSSVSAWFLSTGEIALWRTSLYDVGEEPILSSSLSIAGRDAVLADCRTTTTYGWATFSPTGRLVAWECNGETTILTRDDGAAVATAPAGASFGQFDGDERGYVSWTPTASTSLSQLDYTTLDGDVVHLGQFRTQPGFDYRP